MSRSKRFITGLISSYAAIGVNIIYTLASVPLALHYLDKEEFGLWALVTQLSGYLMLLEFGMGGSVARSLSDHKDQIENGVYGSILKTGGRVFAIQGLLVALMGLVLAWAAPPLLELPVRLHEHFSMLMAAQAILSASRLCLGSLAAPLWCHQRLDLTNLSSTLSLVASFAILWTGFHLGWHLYSLTAASVTGTLLSLLSTYIFCRRLGLYPKREHRGKYDPRLFRELFHFGGGLFLMNLGAQLASASQVIVVSRLLGMEAAAVWSISTKIFSMTQQFVAKVLEASAGGLAEMVVRNEAGQLQKRFCDLVSISAVIAMVASSGIALMNGPFIDIWTAGRVAWPPWNDYLLACVLFSAAVTRCHTGLVGITKQIRGMKFIYLIEGVSFVLLSVLLLPALEFTGLLISALICNIVITGVYGIRRTADYFGISWVEVCDWIVRPACIAVLTAGLFAITRIPTLAGLEAWARIVIGAVILLFVVIPVLLRFGISDRLNREMRLLLSRKTVGLKLK